MLAEHGLAERGPGGWRRGAVALADVAESTGAADLQREREERYKQDRESWRARLRQYQGARHCPWSPSDGWWLAWTTRTSGTRCCTAAGRCSAMTSCAGRRAAEEEVGTPAIRVATRRLALSAVIEDEDALIVVAVG